MRREKSHQSPQKIYRNDVFEISTCKSGQIETFHIFLIPSIRLTIFLIFCANIILKNFILGEYTLRIYLKNKTSPALILISILIAKLIIST